MEYNKYSRYLIIGKRGTKKYHVAKEILKHYQDKLVVFSTFREQNVLSTFGKDCHLRKTLEDLEKTLRSQKIRNKKKEKGMTIVLTDSFMTKEVIKSQALEQILMMGKLMNLNVIILINYPLRIFHGPMCFNYVLAAYDDYVSNKKKLNDLYFLTLEPIIFNALFEKYTNDDNFMTYDVQNDKVYQYKIEQTNIEKSVQ